VVDRCVWCVLAGDANRVGVNVNARSSPAGLRRLGQYGSRTAARIEEKPGLLACQSHHGGGDGRPKGSAAFDLAAMVLPHAYVGGSQAGNDLARPVLDDPHLDIGRVGKDPLGLLPLNRVYDTATKVGALEGSFLEHSCDHPEGGPFSDRSDHSGSCCQRSANPLRSP
jgi:hypothetical protein